MESTQQFGCWQPDVFLGRPIRPTADQPGGLFEQIAAIDVYLSDPTRHRNPDGAWTMARRLTMPHVRFWSSVGTDVEGRPR